MPRTVDSMVATRAKGMRTCPSCDGPKGKGFPVCHGCLEGLSEWMHGNYSGTINEYLVSVNKAPLEAI